MTASTPVAPPSVSWIIRSFYRFVDLTGNRERQQRIERLCVDAGLLGTVLLSTEGINGTLAGYSAALDQVMLALREDEPFAALQWRESYAVGPRAPFEHMKVLIKPQIMTFPSFSPSSRTGTRVPAQQWDELTHRQDMLLLDVRNTYETAVGHFQGALTAPIDHFVQFPDFVHRHLSPSTNPAVAMYCTGGIRCEKAGQWLLAQGFSEVYQLYGGILEYLRHIPASISTWQGECFVFDQRVSVNHRLVESSCDKSHADSWAVPRTDAAAPTRPARNDSEPDGTGRENITKENDKPDGKQGSSKHFPDERPGIFQHDRLCGRRRMNAVTLHESGYGRHVMQEKRYQGYSFAGSKFPE